MPVLSARNLSKAYGPQTLFSGLSLTIRRGERVGLLGINGTGKSTLLRVLAGLEPIDEGVVERRRDATILYLAQEPELDPTQTPREIVESGLAEWSAAMRRHEELSARLGAGEHGDELLAEQAALGERIEQLGGWTRGHVVEDMLTKLQVLEPDRPVGSMSGGERRRVALAHLLVARPMLAILDEPTNHLDVDTVRWLEETLRDYKGTVVMITHDRFFLDNVVGWMLEIWHARAIPYQGNYSEYLIQRQKRMESQEQAEAKRAKFLERELEWIRMNPKARTTKNKARLKNYDKMIMTEVEERDDTVELHIPAGKRLGDTVIRFEKVNFSYDGKTNVVENLSFEMQPGDILGIVGPNGTGKTTVLKLITGKLQPQSGKVTVGATVDLCHVDQERESLDPAKTVWQEISDSQDLIKLGKFEINSRSYVAKFNFTGSDQQQLVGSLSGGQRNRVQLAKMLRRGGNVILLDEPTNDLDLDTLRVLEEGIQEFPGCMVVVSHDRYFLDRICTKILDLGNYEPGKYLDSL